MSSAITTAVIPAAGFGTRFLPVTKALPKELLPVLDTPCLHLLVEEAVSSGITRIVFVINTGKEAIRDYFSASPELISFLESRGKKEAAQRLLALSSSAEFVFVHQDSPKGDGHALLQARDVVGEQPFLVLFGDDLVFGTPTASQQLIAAFENTGSPVVGVTQVEGAAISSYGVVAVDDEKGAYDMQRITAAVEKPQLKDAPSNLAIVGKYVCTPELMTALTRLPPAKEELKLIDGFSSLLAAGDPVYMRYP